MRSAAVPPPYVKDLGEYLAAAGYYTVKREKSDYTISATPTEDDNGPDRAARGLGRERPFSTVAAPRAGPAVLCRHLAAGHS
jgi:hypothetical protein